MSMTSLDDPNEANEASAQHRAAGNALLALGSLSTLVGVVLAIVHIDLRFMDAGALCLTGLGMTAVGVWQRAAARLPIRREADLPD